MVNGKLGGTKTKGSNRKIQMSQFVYDALVEHRLFSFGRSDYVFCNLQGNALDYRNVSRRVWKPTLELLGTNLTF